MIIPAVLTTNKRIARERIALAQHMSGWLHMDVLNDTLYSFESLPLADLEQLDFGTLMVEFHCMTDTPLAILDSSLPVERLILHFELKNWESHYTKLASKGIDTWVAISPETKIKTVHLPDDVGGVVLMGVEPGQTGQAFLQETYDRIEELKDVYPNVALTVDGGVTKSNIRQLIAHGVDNVIMGGGIFHQSDPLSAYKHAVHLSDPLAGASDYHPHS